MSQDQNAYDVIVVGGGNAALTAAISASNMGAKVLLLEKAPSHLRGGNSYFTGGLFRFSYSQFEEIESLLPNLGLEERDSISIEPYPVDKFYSDVMKVTEGLSDPDLLNTLVTQSYPTMRWMNDIGIPWILAYGRQSFLHEGKRRFWGGLIIEAVGGGKGLSDRLFEIAVKNDIDINYGSPAISLEVDKRGSIKSILIKNEQTYRAVKCSAIVLASGGFEANEEMRARYLGPGWELAKVRGTRYNTGDGINMALQIGAQSYGHWSGCHAVAWDLNAPKFGDRNIADLFQKHSYPFGLIVNLEGNRFIDEGSDLRNYTYAKYGKEILNQPQRVAFQIFDQKTKHLLRDEYFIPQVTMVEADTIQQLAKGLGIPEVTLTKTIEKYNECVQEGTFDPTSLDGKTTKGLTPPKSNWALKIDQPPFMGYGVTCGITFTFGGLKIDSQAQVKDTSDLTIPGLFAAGEITGGIFYNNYPGGAGLMSGAVFGKIAGESAAKYAKLVE